MDILRGIGILDCWYTKSACIHSVNNYVLIFRAKVQKKNDSKVLWGKKRWNDRKKYWYIDTNVNITFSITCRKAIKTRGRRKTSTVDKCTINKYTCFSIITSNYYYYWRVPHQIRSLIT